MEANQKEPSYKVYLHLRDPIELFGLPLWSFSCFIGFLIFILLLSLGGIGNKVGGSLVKVVAIGVAFYVIRLLSKDKDWITLLFASKFPSEIHFDKHDTCSYFFKIVKKM